jgi:hypothetical protein
MNLGSHAAGILLTLLLLSSLATGAPLDADKDFVSAIPTTVERLVLAKATRAWRGGMRTLIALNDSATAQRLSSGLCPRSNICLIVSMSGGWQHVGGLQLPD